MRSPFGSKNRDIVDSFAFVDGFYQIIAEIFYRNVAFVPCQLANNVIIFAV